ncbi:MAG: undecaprenyl-phosphate alpha-N-acetylglucosaminyl 1-phosphate transferase [Alteromonadaceae bacterium]|nr:MAG: undecaprenyl-phosphate alpha-N-acetylglucosaminyl 1-phosphate transferase [Alteromonadaceae bacterium]
MGNGLEILVISFVLAFVVVKLLKPVAYWADLVDKPGGRKTHDGLIPLIGGVSIYVSVFLSSLWFLEQPIFIRLFLLSGGLIVFMGVLDDRYDLSARVRLLAQILICSIFVYGLDVHLTSFGNLFGLGEVNVGIFGYPLALLSLMGAMNAFNMMDGVDGLVGSIAVISFVGLAILFGANGDVNFQLLCWAFVGSISAFLVFNIWGKPHKKRFKKVFMGDAGSMFVGLSIGALLIKGSQGDGAAFSPMTSLWLVLLPMTDMFTIMYRRIKRGRSPMEPDRTHLHHMLLRAGFDKRSVLTIMVVVQLSFVVLGLYIVRNGFSEFSSFSLALAFVLAYQLILKRSWRLIRWTRKHINIAH